MFIIGLAGVLAVIAFGTTIGTVIISPVGKVLATVIMAIGATLGVTVNTVAYSTGITALTAASFGIIIGASAVIAGNAAVRNWLKKAKFEGNF
ncbi:hypothetical protein [Cohnella silvisoli]|uniref:Circular bacteriocin, circularin A/uberolysin family n=1 Tax=Cohnella silvisoli TaxID=2873699 RepID=A0ABV1KMQ3_9BACL|nr:hypothetical protein [Cohnella silvisoli]MCD9020294.1 hypothetical protein [Cohnella silvisoli]